MCYYSAAVGFTLELGKGSRSLRMTIHQVAASVPNHRLCTRGQKYQSPSVPLNRTTELSSTPPTAEHTLEQERQQRAAVYVSGGGTTLRLRRVELGAAGLLVCGVVEQRKRCMLFHHLRGPSANRRTGQGVLLRNGSQTPQYQSQYLQTLILGWTLA